MSGPTDKGRHANTPFIEAPLAAAERRIRRRRLLSQPDAAAFLAFLRRTRACREQRAGRAAIVAGKEDNRVVQQFLLFERRDNAADILIQRRDHAGIGLAVLVLDARIKVFVLLRHLVRRVRSQGGEVEEERRLAVLLVDQLDGVVADQRRVVAFLPKELAIALPVDDAAAFPGEVVHLPHDVAVEVIEAAVLRPIFLVGVAEVPFADHVGSVAGFFERLGKCALVSGQPKGVAGEDNERLQPVTHRIAAGHQSRTRGSAYRLTVKRLQPDALLGELVDIRRLDLAAAVTEVGIAQIVGHDEDDIGSAPPLVQRQPRKQNAATRPRAIAQSIALQFSSA